MSFRHTYVLRFPCSFPQVGRRVSIVHAHVYARVYVRARMRARSVCARIRGDVCMCRELDMDRVHISKFNFE